MTTTFSVSRDDIITAALRKIGVVAQGETPTAVQVTEASFALNTLVKAWQADGMPLWALRTTPIPLVAGQATYTIGTDIANDVVTDKPLKVIRAWSRTVASAVDVPMRILTKQEYDVLGNKTTVGDPIQIYYSPELINGSLFVFPTPSSTDATNSVVYIVYQRPFEDFVLSTDTPDFPSEWYDAVVYGLAVRLAPEYGLPLDQRQILNKEATEIKTTALSFGTEEGSLYFRVDMRGW